MFNLKQNIDFSEYKSAAVGTSVLEINPLRGIDGSNAASFASGDLIFRWSLPSNEYWSPSTTRLRMRVKWTQADGIEPLDLTTIGPAYDFANALFQSMRFTVAGKTVSELNVNLAQCSALRIRQKYSSTWQQTVGQYTQSLGTFEQRNKSVVPTDPPTQGAATTHEYMVELPLSIFSYPGLLPGVQCELTLRPLVFSAMQIAAVQHSLVGAVTGGSLMTVQQCYLEVPTFTGPRLGDNAEYYIDLREINAQSLILGASAYNPRLFEVSPNSVALTVAYQDSRIDPKYPSGLFKWDNGLQLSLQRFQIQFGSQYMPVPSADIEYQEAKDTTSVDYTTQLWLQGQISNGLIFSDTGGESLPTWQSDLGLYLHYNFPRSASDSSTQCNVYSQFSAPPTNGKVLLFNHTRSVCKIVHAGGSVVEVVVQEV